MNDALGAGRHRRGLFRLSAPDVDRVLLGAVFAAVALVVVAVGYLVYAVIAKPVAPRTEVERRVYYYEQAVKANPARADFRVAYAGALVDAGQYTKASEVIAEGLRKVEDKAGLLLQRARLERLQDQEDRALKTADAAIAAVADHREKVAEEAAKKGMGAPLQESPEIVQAEILKADIYTERGKTQQAIDAYTRALKEDPLMADVLSARGDLYLKLGDDDAARKDYREALRYDPQNVAARDGLKKLGDAEQ